MQGLHVFFLCNKDEKNLMQKKSKLIKALSLLQINYIFMPSGEIELERCFLSLEDLAASPP